MTSSNKCCLVLKVVFCQMSSYVKDFILSNVGSPQSSLFVKVLVIWVFLLLQFNGILRDFKSKALSTLFTFIKLCLNLFDFATQLCTNFLLALLSSFG